MLSYLELLRDVLVNGEGHQDRTGVGTRSVFGRQWRHKMVDGFPRLTTKPVPLRWVFEELRWFLSGSTDAADLQRHGVNIWDEWATPEQCAKFCREPGQLGPIYGHLWRNFGGWDFKDDCNVPGKGEDQIANLMHDLEHIPNSRRLLVSGWDPKCARIVALPPCHTLWQIKVHQDGSISLELYARSIDIFLGLPFNIASYGLLLLMIAKAAGRVANELVISFGDLHLYKNAVEAAKIQLDREPYDLPVVSIDPWDGSDWPSLDRLLSYTWEDVDRGIYRSHPKLSVEVAV